MTWVRARQLGSSTRRRAIRCSSSSSWRWGRRTRTPRCRRAFRRYSPHVSIASRSASERCSSSRRSRDGASTSARVEELLPEPDRAGIAEHLVSLVHKQLIRADRSDMAGQDAFRFSHALIGEVAYQGMPKAASRRTTRARGALARSIDRTHRTRPSGTIWARPAATWPSSAGSAQHERRWPSPPRTGSATAADAALLRGDAPAGARLLQRAESLLESDDPTRAELLPALGAALFEAGELERAEQVLTEAIEHAGADQRLRSRALVERRARPPAGRDRPVRPTRSLTSWTRRSERSRATSAASAVPCVSRRSASLCRGSCRRGRRGLAARRRARAPGRRRGGAVRDPRLAGLRGPVWAHPGAGRDSSLPADLRPGPRQPGRRRPDVPADGGAARDGRRLR